MRLKSRIVDFISHGVPCEIEYTNAETGEVVGYWAYGCWDRAYEYTGQPGFEHKDHGRGDDNGPYDEDCGCRGTNAERICSKAGCGFCKPTLPCGCHCKGGCCDPYAPCAYPCAKHVPY